jgi:predicted NAD/FAD-binding protein
VAQVSVACHLRNDADISIIANANDCFRGRANTIEVIEDGRAIDMDTPCVCSIDPFCPHLTALFDELNAQMIDHKGSSNFVDLATSTLTTLDH